MSIFGIYRERREAPSSQATYWDPIDSDRDLVIVERSTRGPNDPIRHGETPARPAQIQIAHTGIRPDWQGEEDGRGLHVQIDHSRKYPRGRQATWVERVNIASPRAASSYGDQYEIPAGTPTTEDESVALLMGV